jgi:hypothetical protein
MPDPTPERETADAGVAERPARSREALALARRVEVLPQRPASAGRRPRHGIDDDAAHQAQVDHHRPVADAVAGDAVTASTHGDRQVGLPRVPHCRGNVVDVKRPGDQGGPPVDRAVEGDPGCVIAGVVRRDDGTAMDVPELGERLGPHGTTLTLRRRCGESRSRSRRSNQ